MEREYRDPRQFRQWELEEEGKTEEKNSWLWEEYPETLAEEQEAERDAKALQSMFPQEARAILPWIREACDQMEYEGSRMFDSRPDQTAVRRLGEEILEKGKEQGAECSWQMVQVLLLEEMYRRRQRRRRCRKNLFKARRDSIL